LFIRREKELYESGKEEYGWWTAYYTSGQLEARIRNMMDPAENAGEVYKWCSNFDFICAAILYETNFVLCKKNEQKAKKNDGCKYKWEIYSPGRKIETVRRE
jgi:hypothetical protein